VLVWGVLVGVWVRLGGTAFVVEEESLCFEGGWLIFEGWMGVLGTYYV